MVVSNTSPLMNLDPGESEAITLALEQKAELILLDESEGRKVAARYGLNKTGILGLLLRAKNEKLIASLKHEMDRLQYQAHFWINPSLYQKLLHAAEEAE